MAHNVLHRRFIAGVLPVLAAFLAATSANYAAWGAEGTATPQTPASLDSLIKQVEANPNSARSHMLVAQRYEQQGFLSLARDQYEQATNCPNPPPEAFKFLAQISLRMQMGKEATEIVRQAAQRFPKDFGIFLTAGYVLQNQNKLDEAQRMYDHAAQLKPDNPAAHGALADIYFAMHRYDKALAESDKALAVMKDFDVGNYEKARALGALGRPNEAVDLLQKNFSRDPLGTLNNRLYAGTLLQANRPDEALLPLLSLLATSDGKKMAETKMEIAQLISRMPQARVQAALAKSDAALAKTAVRARMHFAMGDVFDKLNQHAAAMKEYERGNQLDPKYPRGYLRLAEDLEVYSQDYEKAMTNYRKAFALDNNDPEISMRMQHLSRTLADQRNPFKQIQNWFNGLFHH